MHISEEKRTPIAELVKSLVLSKSDETHDLVELSKSFKDDEQSSFWKYAEIWAWNYTPLYKNVIILRLTSQIQELKNDLLKHDFHPVLLDNIAVMLKGLYKNYSDIVDIVPIQKEIFSECYNKIEESIIKKFYDIINSMIKKNVPVGWSFDDAYRNAYEFHKFDYETYFYWPQIQAIFDVVSENKT